MLDLNATFLIQLANFIITIVVLNLILYKPIRGIIRKRAEVMGASLGEIEKFTKAADLKVADYEKALEEARRKGVEARNKFKDEGFGREKELVDAASREAATFMKSAREKIDADTKAASSALTAKVESYAQKATAKIFG